MIRFLLRFVGLLLLALGFIFLVYDGIRWLTITEGGILPTKASDVWGMFNERTLAAVQTWVESNGGADVWRIGIAPILEQPASVVACVLGIILILLGRKKKPLIGYARD
jgi:hypothetical protein